jgi:hypothetical protein
MREGEGQGRMVGMRPSPSTSAETRDPTPDPRSTVVRSGSRPEDDAIDEVWTVADPASAQRNAERVLGGSGGSAREAALVEAGRLYGRDHARARAALEDGTHPLCRLKTRAG